MRSLAGVNESGLPAVVTGLVVLMAWRLEGDLGNPYPPNPDLVNPPFSITAATTSNTTTNSISSHW